MNTKETKKPNPILNKDKIIFEQEDSIAGIESVFSFKDGDLLVFQNKFSIIYDGKTFNKKLKLDFLGASCAFCYLSEKEFILLKDFYFSLYRFDKNRTNFKEIYTVDKNKYQETNKKIFNLSNNNLISLAEIYFTPVIKVFGRIEDNYELIENHNLKDIDEVINLENDEFLTIKKFMNQDYILLKVYNNKDYIVNRKNEINCILNGKRRIYFSDLPILKVDKNKILIGGIMFLNIICTETLQLETTIKISPQIKSLRLLGNNCIILIETLKNFKEIKYNLTRVWINFIMNDIIKKESIDITEEMGEFKTLFGIHNYMDKGLATIGDQYQLKIYENLVD